MDRIKSSFTAIKNGAQDFYEDLENWFYADQRKGLLTFAAILAGIALFSVSMVMAQARVRQSEYDEIIYPELVSERMKTIPYGEEDQLIKTKSAVSVMFAPPHGDERNQVDRLLQQKHAELNRDFFYYPLVYDTVNIGERYNIDPTKVTFVFFEKGVEKNRLEFAKLEDKESAFIPELNRLPMWNIKNLDEEN